MRAFCVVLAMLAAILGGWGAGGAAAAQAASAADGAVMPNLVRRYQADARSISRFYAVAWSDVHFERLEEFYAGTLKALDALAYDALGVDDRVDWHLLKRHVEWRQAGLGLGRARRAEMEPLMPFLGQVQKLELARRRMEACDPKEAAATLTEATAAIKGVRARVDDGRKAAEERGEDAIVPTAVVAARAAGVLDELAWRLDTWAGSYDEFDPAFSWWTRRPREDCQKELRDLAKVLREEVAGVKGEPEDPLIGDPIGEAGLAADLQGEAIAYSARELIEIGERELAWCESEMKKASGEIGQGDEWKAALARVKEGHLPPGEQDDFVRDEARAAIEFLKERDLLSIPELCEETWRVEMHSVETQRTLPFAVYGGQYMGVSYAAGSMPHEDKVMSMRGNNRHFTHIVTPHELIPGHHLQGFVEDRERAYRSMFSTPFLVEGWALYWEFRLWDLGWAGATGQDEAMDKVGMLFWRMHRAARIIVSLRFHLGEMTAPEMIDFLVERVGHERMGATSEVRRYIAGDYSPLYQCAYMIGGLQLRELRREMVERGGMSEKAFNDGVLGQNSIPIELMRAGMKGERLPKEWEAGWRFAE